MTVEEAVVHAHKRAHGLTPWSEQWDDPRWETEWAFDVASFIACLRRDGFRL